MRVRTLHTGIALGLISIAALAACDRRSKPFVPIEQEPPAPERVKVPGLEMPTAAPVMPTPRSAVERLQADAPSVGGASGGGEEIQGTIRLADGVQPGPGTLFVIARAGGGPPLAVRKLDASAFPVAFSIGASDMMIPGRRFEGEIAITARLDRDGNPMSREPGDLVGVAAGAVQPGATGVQIVLSAAEPSAASAPAMAGAGGAAAEIQGTIRLGDGVQAGPGVLFVIARTGAGGPPLAVRKLDASAFPVRFSIGPSDMMIPGRRFEGEIAITARLDRDGNPMSRDPDDLSGAAALPVQPGAGGVEIVLKRGAS